MPETDYMTCLLMRVASSAGDAAETFINVWAPYIHYHPGVATIYPNLEGHLRWFRALETGSAFESSNIPAPGENATTQIGILGTFARVKTSMGRLSASFILP